MGTTQVCFRPLVAVLSGLLLGLQVAPALASDLQFDEPFEGHTRACVGQLCVDSPSSSVTRSISGSISSLNLLAAVPPPFQPFAKLLDLQNYQTSQNLRLDLVDEHGRVLNQLDVAFSVAQLQYSAAFIFRSDAAGALTNGPGADVLSTGAYQAVTEQLQSQLDLSGLPFPFGSFAGFFQPEFLPFSASIRSGSIASPVPEPPAGVLLVAGLLLLGFAVTRRSAAWGRIGLAALGVALSVPAGATLVTNNLLFGAFDQSPFTTGAAFNKSDSTTIGPPAWNVSLPLGTFPAPNPVGFLLPTLSTRGQVGLEFGYAVSGGKLDLNYPLAATLALPNSAPAGGQFTVNTTAAPKADGFRFSQSSDIADVRFRNSVFCTVCTGAQPAITPGISTTFPSAAAYLDFFARSENTFKLNVTYLNPNPLHFGYETKTLRDIELPGFDEKRFKLFELNRNGIQTAVPGISIPFDQDIAIIPQVLSTYFHYPDLATSGGLDSAGALVAGGQQTVANLNLDVIGLASTVFPIIPPLKDSFDFGIGSIDYKIIDVNSGLDLLLRQDFSFEAQANPFLYFDTPVAARSSNGTLLAPSNIVALPANGALDVELPNDLPRSSVTVQPFYLLQNTLKNVTSLALSGYLKLEALAAQLNIDVGFASIREGFGPLVPRTGPQGDLFSFPVFEDKFPVNVTPIWTQPFEFGVDPAQNKTARATFVSHLPNGRAIYNIREIQGAEFSKDLGNFAGREYTGLGGAIEFVSELPVSYNGHDYGKLFCVFCPEVDAAPDLRSSFSTAIDGQGVYFNDLHAELFSPPAAGADQDYLDAFLSAHTATAPGTANEAQVLFSQDFVPPLFAVPVSGTASLLAVGLAALGATRRRAWRALQQASKVALR